MTTSRIGNKPELKTNLEENQKELSEKNQFLEKLRKKDKEKKVSLVEVPNPIYEKQRKEISVSHYNLGTLLMQQDEYERAAKEFTYAIEQDPENSYAHL